MVERGTELAYDLFISYAEADSAWVEGYLLDALTQAGVRYHSEAAFELGKPRLLEFERVIQQSQRTLLVLSPAYLSEGFTQFTDLLAQSYGLETATWPVIPLILHPVKLPPRLAMLTALDATDPARWPAVVERLCTELQRPVPGPMPRPPCPYPGMVPFSEADSGRFFGRDKKVQELLECLRLHPFATVIGPSGSGKSSLVFAGLVPALRKSGLFGSGGWLVRTLRPGEAPLATLAAALGGAPADPARAVSELLAAQPDACRLLLVVDQFEELFTLARQDTTPFQQALLRLAEIPNCYLVLTVRADFYPDLMVGPLWQEIQAHRVEVLPLDEDGLRQAIVRPAEDVGVFVETALVERLMADAAGEPGVLPLVQETMVLLWERVERRLLPLRAYEALVLPRAAYGVSERTGLQVAMARRADAALTTFTLEQQAIARRIFLRLVQFGEGRADTRRQQSVGLLRSAGDDPAEFDQTLEHLTCHRLLTLSGEEEDGDRKADIAHEALIGGWPTLQGWLMERREAEQTRRRLEAKAAEWVRLGWGSGGLLDEVELLEAERWLVSPDAADLGTSDELSALMQASEEAQERERRATRMRRIGITAVVVMATAIVVAVITLAATGQWSQIFYRPLPMEWVTVPAGKFLMGSSDAEIAVVYEACPSCDVLHEQPQHSVYLDQYQIGRYEVTNKQYRQCVCAGICNTPNNTEYDNSEFDDYPVTDVDWEDARTFCEWIGGRLPSEAEWEKAAHGPTQNSGDTQAYPWGNEWDPQKANADRSDAGEAMPVGSYSPSGDSPYSISDMAGNVWEWVMDWYDPDYYDYSPASNPPGPESGTYRVLRGGSFSESNTSARSAYRLYYYPGSISGDIGFRCVLPASP